MIDCRRSGGYCPAERADGEEDEEGSRETSATGPAKKPPRLPADNALTPSRKDLLS